MVNGGIDESLQEGVLTASGNGKGGSTALMHPLSQGGYGRAYEVSATTLHTLVENMKQVFSTERILFYGDGERTLRKAASFCGAGVDDASVAFAKRSGADVVISADFKHHHVQFLVESGISVIVLTHYASEQYGFRKYYKKICQAVEIPCVYHTDNELF
jgi:putative NIF3 family GTP cyclohydrolase 1 type 2